MADIRTIPGSSAIVRAEHFDSLMAAFASVEEASGIRPRVLGAAEVGDGIPGGGRTLAEAQRAGSGAASDHYIDNARGRAAVDIDNQRAIRNKIGSGAFEALMADQGWRNIQINGAPFPSEPWHFARHVSGGASPSTGSGFRADVKWDQERLNVWAAADGVPKIEEDGIRGRETIARTKDFQRKHGLEDDGIAGPKTDAVLATDPAPADTHPYPGRTEWGTKGTGITIQYQRRLAELGYNVGPLDDDHGRKTTDALVAFQTAKGIQVDGIGGPETWKNLWA